MLRRHFFFFIILSILLFEYIENFITLLIWNLFMVQIKKVVGREVLDSRGNPTVEVDVLGNDFWGRAIVPSGASTGIHEALELRDNTKRFLKKGVSKAVNNVNTIISKKLKGFDINQQRTIDDALIALDGTRNKKNLGANAVLGTSMAVARGSACAQGRNLYESLSKKLKFKPLLPVPFANIINGGVHAGNKLALQEFMIVPTGAKTFTDATRIVAETYHILKDVIIKKYGKNAANVGDEGGFAPPISSGEEALELITNAIDKAGYSKQLKIAMDAAASEFYTNKNYFLESTKKIDSNKLADYYHKIIGDYPIISLEDPFDQDDFESWKSFTKDTKIQVVGDDLTTTNPEMVAHCVKEKLCNALLLKVNQIGTLSEATNAAKLSYKNNWNVMVSHRSGESEDTFIADLSVGLASGQIKLGAPCRGERTAKYNQLMRIEEELGKKARFAKNLKR